MPLVQLTGAADSANAGQVIWVWSIHNPANTHGNAAGAPQGGAASSAGHHDRPRRHRNPGGDPGRLQRRQGRPERLPLRAHTRAEQRLRRVGRAVQEAQGGRADRPHLRRQPHLGQRPRRQQHPDQQDRRPPAGGRHHRRQQRRLRRRRRRPTTTSARSSRSWPSWSTSSARCSTSRPSAATARAPPTPTDTPQGWPPTSWSR